MTGPTTLRDYWWVHFHCEVNHYLMEAKYRHILNISYRKELETISRKEENSYSKAA